MALMSIVAEAFLRLPAAFFLSTRQRDVMLARYHAAAPVATITADLFAMSLFCDGARRF